jgi:type IV pilus assembly protein PilV
MALTAIQNNRGFTLVEVMISMLVLLVGMLGSLVGVMAAADYNLGNALRDEAVKIAQEQLENARTGQFALVVNASVQVQRQVRKALHTFQVTTNVTAGGPSNSLRLVSVTVQWTFKNTTRSHLSETIVRQRVII